MAFNPHQYACQESIAYIDEVLAERINFDDPFFTIGTLQGALEVLKIQLSVAESDPIGPGPASEPIQEPF